MTDRRRYSSGQSEDANNYSDEFSDDDPMPSKSAPEKQRTRGRGGRNQGKGRVGRGRGGGRNSQARSDTQVDVVTKQLLSANRLKMDELTNQVEDMRKQMKIITEENKLFKRMQQKQEKALVKFEDRESELPQLILAHNNEVRSLREQLRRTRDKYEKTDRYLRDAEDELERVNTKMKKYKALSDQKDLAERSDLDKRLNKAELGIEEKECRIKELERHMEILKKNHRHELGIERARYKDAQKQLDDVRENNSQLEVVLREKEKQLEAKNIYSNRPGGKPSSYSGTPVDSPAPWRQNLNKKKSESLSDLAPRNKARVYEEKRRAADGTRKKEKEKPPPAQRPNHRPSEPRQKWEDEDREKSEPTANTTIANDSSSSHGPNFTFSSLQRQDSEADFWRRQEEKYKQDKDNREKQENDRSGKATTAQEEEEEEKKESARFQQQREKFQRDMEERERREREREDADATEREEGERREREERERRERERREKERLDNDPRLVEERRKKDELLRRLQQLDANREGSQPDSGTKDPFAPSDSTRRRPVGGGGDHLHHTPSSDPFAPSPSKKPDRDPFSPSTGEGGFSISPSHKKDYAFTRPVENLHRGKPSHEESRHRKGKGDDDIIGGYQPSFSGKESSGSGKKKKPASFFDDDLDDIKPAPRADSDRKTRLMSDLFGSHLASTTKKKEDEGDSFFLTSKSPPPASKPTNQNSNRTSGFPWEGSSASKARTNGTGHRESSTLFGGGAALVDDDVGGGGPKSTMLPKRSRQPPTTFSSKPAVGDVDDLDDDIEEVML